MIWPRLYLLFLLYSILIVLEEEDGDRIKIKKLQSTDGFSLDDIEADEDWKRIEPILLKYFKPYQVEAKNFFRPTAVKKHYWRKLNSLIEDLGDEFEAYCKWYRTNKYPRVKFNYGMFLYPSVVSEFKEDSEPDPYLNVPKRLESSESFNRELEEADSWLVKFDNKEDGDEG